MSNQHKAQVAVFRPVITTDEILGTLEALSCIPLNQLSSGARSLLAKFQTQAFKIDAGIANPVYVTSPRTPRISIESLGGTTDSSHDDDASKFFSSPQGPQGPQVNTEKSAELSPEMKAELERLNAAMLAELAGNGAGSENVVLEERRRVPRTSPDTLTDTPTPDTINIHDL